MTAAAPGDYIQLRQLDGTVIGASFVPQFSGTEAPPPPKLPATIALPAASAGGGDRVTYLTVPSQSERQPLARARVDRAVGTEPRS